MGLIRKLLDSKTEMETYIIKYGIKKAVKTYSLEKLVRDGFLTNIDRTQLYRDCDLSFVPSVFDKQGQYLGDISCLMNPFYKQLGNFDSSCLNGNIILTCRELNGEKFKSRTYGVFDKQGNQLVEYGKYFTHEFLQEGVVLMNGDAGELVNAVKIGYSGAITYQDYFKIEEYFPTGDLKGKKMYKIYKKVGDRVDNELVDYYPEHNYPSFEE